MSTALSHPAEPLTPEVVDAMRDGGHLYELIDGELVERSMSVTAGRVVTRVAFHLHLWLEENPIADVIDAETSFACFPAEPRKMRRADVAAIRVERITQEILTGVVRVAPDLVVEVVSPGDLAGNVLAKAGDWRRAGAAVVWIIDPINELALTFSEDGDRIVHKADPLEGGRALPGFSRPLADFLKIHGPALIPPPVPNDPPAD